MTNSLIERARRGGTGTRMAPAAGMCLRSGASGKASPPTRSARQAEASGPTTPSAAGPPTVRRRSPAAPAQPMHPSGLCLRGPGAHSEQGAIADAPLPRGKRFSADQTHGRHRIAIGEACAQVSEERCGKAGDVSCADRRMPDIIARFDSEGRYLFISENIRRVGGLDAVQFIGKTNREMGFPHDEAQCRSGRSPPTGARQRRAPRCPKSRSIRPSRR